MRSFAELTVAAAIPKGERADWMVEKLSELGVAKLVPLETDRGVVRPEGTHKRERWQRIATESAKQSRRSGVMRIEPTATVESQLPESPLICLATEVDAEPLAEVVQSLGGATKVRLLIGPEGGWTAEELQSFRSAGATFARMTETILRIETAAVAAAAVTAMLLKPR